MQLFGFRKENTYGKQEKYAKKKKKKNVFSFVDS